MSISVQDNIIITTIHNAVREKKNLVFSGAHQGKALDILDSMTGNTGQMLSTGAIAYKVKSSTIIVGDMPRHPSLIGAQRMNLTSKHSF